MGRYNCWNRRSSGQAESDNQKSMASPLATSLTDTGPVISAFTPINQDPTIDNARSSPIRGMDKGEKRKTDRPSDDYNSKHPAERAYSAASKESLIKLPRKAPPLKPCVLHLDVTCPGHLDETSVTNRRAHPSEEIRQTYSLDKGPISEILSNRTENSYVVASSGGEVELSLLSDAVEADCLNDDMDDGLDQGIDDHELSMLADTVNSNAANNFAPQFPKLNWGSPKRYQQPAELGVRAVSNITPQKGTGIKCQSSPLTSSPLSSYASFVSKSIPSKQEDSSPSTSFGTLQSPRHLIPFVDPQFLLKVPEKPSIPGISSQSRIITHFRLGQALNHVASEYEGPGMPNVVIELYARVLRSYRQGHRQVFELADLFHYDRPPYLNADWVGWQGLPYFELDGEAFLQEPSGKKLCRAIGQIEKIENRVWRMCILSIWEASWDDVEAVKGIICI